MLIIENKPKNLIEHFKIQRSFESKLLDIDVNFPNEDEKNPTDIYFDELIGGGTYCVDFYRYLKTQRKRYKTISPTEIRPVYTFRQLDIMFLVSPSEILIKEDPDDIFQIYDEGFRQYLIDPMQDTMAHFYIFMAENYCYLIDIFVDKIVRVYGKKLNPFNKILKKNTYASSCYALDPFSYLYNKRLINAYPIEGVDMAIKSDKPTIITNKAAVVDILRFRTTINDKLHDA